MASQRARRLRKPAAPWRSSHRICRAQRRPRRSSTAIIGCPVREPRTGVPGRGVGIVPPSLRYDFRSATDFIAYPRGDPMDDVPLPVRIRPLEPPYAPAVEATLAAMMPRNSPIEPLRLFRTLAQNLPLGTAMTALGSFVLGR